VPLDAVLSFVFVVVVGTKESCGNLVVELVFLMVSLAANPGPNKKSVVRKQGFNLIQVLENDHENLSWPESASSLSIVSLRTSVVTKIKPKPTDLLPGRCNNGRLAHGVK
jgi:hypothetical protein